jgi:hypothetical protein
MQKTLDRETVLKHFLVQLAHFAVVKQVALTGHGTAFSALLNGKPVHGVTLVRSSDFWKYRLHLRSKQQSPVGLVVCYRHDSVVPVHVLALEDGRDYEPEDLPGKYSSLDAVIAEHSRHAAKVMLGALLCGLKSAHDALGDEDMPESTRRKYEAKMHMYQRRRQGRPLAS